jgi:hypothetical protein
MEYGIDRSLEAISPNKSSREARSLGSGDGVHCFEVDKF